MSEAEAPEEQCRSRLIINGEVVASLIVKDGLPSFRYSQEVFPEPGVASEAAVALYEALSVGKKRKRANDNDSRLETLAKRKRSLITAIDKAAQRTRDSEDEPRDAPVPESSAHPLRPRLDIGASLRVRALPPMPPQSPRPSPVSV